MVQNVDARDVLAALWRGGRFAYWWTPDGPPYTNQSGVTVPKANRSHWFPLAAPWPHVPQTWRAGCNVYFPVHPLHTIPTNNRNGRRQAPQYVRGGVAQAAAINCLYAEYDARDESRLWPLRLRGRPSAMN